MNLDVRDAHHWEEVVSHASDTFGHLDVLVNYAGVVSYSRAVDCSDGEWERTIAINQTGVFYGMRNVIPQMRRRGRGSPINTPLVYGELRGVDGYLA